jgi:hypothetical protein
VGRWPPPCHGGREANRVRWPGHARYPCPGRAEGVEHLSSLL